MSYSQIANTEIDASSPLTETLLTKIRDNIKDHVHGVSDVAGLPSLTVGDYAIYSNDPERSTSSATYTKLKEIKILRNGNFRVTFVIRSGDGLTVYGKVYKNGTAIGTERNTGNQSGVQFSEDFTGLVVGDLIQVYANAGTANFVFVRELNICCAEEGANYNY